MGPSGKRTTTAETPADREMREQEVLRANRELAAYFRGRRTEREARAALKIIKAFVRERARRDARTRPPLPLGRATRTPQKSAARRTRGADRPTAGAKDSAEE